jgi:hypothetical protein
VSGLRTFSYGGGVQSTAALVLAAQGRLGEPPPVFLFCNVGDDSEYPPTLRYYAEHAQPYAHAHGIRLHELWRVVNRGPHQGRETLYGRLTRPGSRSLPIPVRMPDTGAPGTRSCTADFKIAVVARWLREHGATPERPAVTGLGISVDEVHRARSDSGIAWQRLWYPLLELRLRRSDCAEVIRRAGLPVPPKSACWFCPFHRPEEWRRMKRAEPELFARACDLEAQLIARRRALGRDPVYLSRFGRPLGEAFAADQGVLFDPNPSADLDACEAGYCMA